MRRNSFDAIRLVAAGLVLYAHSFAVLGFEQPRIWGGTVGWLGVEIFFATSGYLIATSWRAEPRFSRFAWKRCLRLVPALVPLGLMLALVASLGIFDGNPRTDLNPSLWSLPVEVRCYLLVAVLGIAGALRRPAVALAVYVALLFMLLWQVNPEGILFGSNSGFHGPQVVVAAFAGGMLMQWVPRRRLFLAAALVVLVAFPLYVDRFPHYEVVWALTIPYLVVHIGERFTVRLRHDLSYGLYIWGWPVQQAVVALGVTAPLAIFPLAVTGTGLVALGSWLLVERPALRLKTGGVIWPRVAPSPSDR